jgi:hypothetical protein
MRALLLSAVLGLTTALLGCGGNVIVPDRDGGGGSAGGAGGASACPALEPRDGDACATPGLTCVLSGTCCGPTATCSGGIWSVPPPACAEACASCGPTACQGICVTVEGALSSPLDYHCAPDPCAGQTPSCACAGSLCPTGCDGFGSGTLLCY